MDLMRIVFIIRIMLSTSHASYYCSNIDRKSTRLNSSHLVISYAVFCLKKKNTRLSAWVYALQSPTIVFLDPVGAVLFRVSCTESGANLVVFFWWLRVQLASWHADIML